MCLPICQLPTNSYLECFYLEWMYHFIARVWQKKTYFFSRFIGHLLNLQKNFMNFCKTLKTSFKIFILNSLFWLQFWVILMLNLPTGIQWTKHHKRASKLTLLQSYGLKVISYKKLWAKLYPNHTKIKIGFNRV